MKFSITIDGQPHTLELMRENGLTCLLDGSPFEADLAEAGPGVYSLLIGGKSFRVRVEPEAGDSAASNGKAGDYRVEVSGVRYAVTVKDPRSRRAGRPGGHRPAPEGQQNITARMPGKVVRILVAEGQEVQRGQGLIVVEAMKMQNEIQCPASGRIQKVLVREGQAVNTGESLVVVE